MGGRESLSRDPTQFLAALDHEQHRRIESLARGALTRVGDVPVYLDLSQPPEPQLPAVVSEIGLTSVEWQSTPLLIRPPGHAPAAAVLLAELHGRIGSFPAIVWLRREIDKGPTRYEVAEIVNLQGVRDRVRHERRDS